MKDNHFTLFGKGAHGIRVWEIWSSDNNIIIEANGQLYHENIPEGKAGRSIQEQIQLRINARVRNKLDNGFKMTREEAAESMTNQLNLPLPMLAKKHTDVKFDIRNSFIQPKLDGHRCLITKNDDGEIIAYSRRGKIIDTIGHITRDLSIPDGVVLDGELYCHGESLQTIASWAKRLQPNSNKLHYHAYDLIPMFDLNMSFEERFDLLVGLQEDASNRIEVVRTGRVGSKEDLSEMLIETIDDGYEGLIVRPIKGTYGIGKRSNDLIKVKRRYDAEFKCVDVIPSRDGWGILVLQAHNGKLFKSLAPGAIHEKILTLQNKEKYIGRYVTAEFAELTDDGIPFHAACIRWRIDI